MVEDCTKTAKLYQGDCLKIMPEITDKSIDMIFCDLPYGTTHNKWDKKIPLEPLFAEYNRIIKNNGAIVLFAQQPFETDLINANRRYFRYEWIWDKRSTVGFLNANKMPLRRHENLVVFYKHLPTYNPQFSKGKPYSHKSRGITSNYSTYYPEGTDNKDGRRYPTDIIENFSNAFKKDSCHPTQKPVGLCEYFIKTYTNEGETVFDNCMGVGSAGVACVNTNRRFIGIELDEGYYEKAKERIKNAESGGGVKNGVQQCV